MNYKENYHLIYFLNEEIFFKELENRGRYYIALNTYKKENAFIIHNIYKPHEGSTCQIQSCRKVSKLSWNQIHGKISHILLHFTVFSYVLQDPPSK